MKLKWPKWPENLHPWYIILRRLPFIPVFYIGLAISWAGLLLTLGHREAKRFWLENW